ncbi:MAG: NAD-dependent epimerase/dehydratase family protein [Bryobacteraceae bacterium]
MQVFLTGATGYIGGAVAHAMIAAGHNVICLARNEEKAGQLASLGCRSRIGALTDPKILAEAARAADGAIHAAFSWGADAPQVDGAAVDAMLQALEGSRKPFLYTSGAWVMGSTGDRIAGESAPLRPPEIVAWRQAVERRVLDATERGVRGVVIRPAVVFGRNGGMAGTFVRLAREQGVVRIVGEGKNRWSWVHVDDLADLYVRAFEKAGAGELFLAADGPAVPVGEVAQAAAGLADPPAVVRFLPVEEARKEMGPLADALLLDQCIGSTKAGRLLGWVPKRRSVLEELAGGSYAAFKGTG